jgi:hypothetical protein
MALADLLNLPVTLVQRTDSGTLDDYGNDIPTEVEVETVCELQQRRRDEPDGHGEMSSADFLLVLPAGTDARTADIAVIDGQDYEFVGDPWIARNPRTGVVSHVECTVRRTAGAGDEGAGS